MATINSALSLAVISNLLGASNDINTSVLNLSSGVKSNASVADFSVGSLLAYQSATLSTANVNAGQGKSLATTAKSALDQILSLLNDQKTLATQAADASLTDTDRANLNLEFQSITDEINRIATTTKFNSKVLLDGSASGTADLTTATGQSTENYTLLSTSDFSLSGTTASGYLDATGAFGTVATTSVGDVAGTAVISFDVSGVALAANAQVTINGSATVDFGLGTTTKEALATAFVAAAEASTNSDVRRFTYKDNGDGTVTVTTADLGDTDNAITFNVTGTDSGKVTTATFGGDNIIASAQSLSSISTKTLGSDRTLASGYSATLDSNLQGQLTGFTATLDTSGTQNTAIFTVDINGQTYTSQAVTLFGTGGYNSKGNTIKNGQVITFYNSSGATDSAGEFTDNAFTLTVDSAAGVADDITVSGASQDAFQTSLTTIAQSFTTQLDPNHINQSRSLVLSVTNATGGDFEIAAANGTIFDGILGFDAVGTNAKGNVNFIGDIFGTDGNVSNIGPFSYDSSTYTISTTINGEVYSADLSSSAATLGALTTEGLANGTGGSFNTATGLLTVGTGTTDLGTATTIVFHSASTTDGKQLLLDLSNLTDKSIDLSTSTLSTAFTDDLDTIFGVSNNPTLSFQVGASPTDTITLAIANSQTTALYKDDAGAGKTLSIATVSGATEASSVLDNAVNNVLSRIATVSSSITSFSSAITTNSVQINNFDAASNSLLNTDYALESTILADATLRYNSGISVLVQNQQRLQNLLKLLS